MTTLTGVLSSSVLDEFEYNVLDNTLTVWFASGNEARYHNVPVDVVVELASAESAGRYFNDNIKGRFNPQFSAGQSVALTTSLNTGALGAVERVDGNTVYVTFALPTNTVR